MKQLNKNIFWNAIGNTAYNGLQWLITIIVARNAGLDETGVLSIAMSLSLIFRTIAYFGIRNYQVSDSCEKYSVGDYSGLRVITSAASIILCMVFAVLSGYNSEVLTAIFWYMLFRISESASDLFQGIMQKADRLDSAGKCLFVKAVATTLAFTVTFSLTSSLNHGLCAMSLFAVAEAVFVEFPIAVKLSNSSICAKWSCCAEMVRETAPLLVQLMLTAIVFNTPKYMLSLLNDESYLGAYSSIFSVATIMQGCFQYLYVPFTTEFTKLHSVGNNVAFKKLAIKILLIFIVFAVLFSAVMYFGGMPVLAAVFGKEILQYRFMLMPTIISVCVYCFMTFVSTLKVITRDFRSILISHITGAFFCVAGTAVFMKFFSFNGESYGFILGCTASVVIMLFHSPRQLFSAKKD